MRDEATTPYARVVVPLDGSVEAERAVEHAVAIAEKTGSPLVLVGVTTGGHELDAALADTATTIAVPVDVHIVHAADPAEGIVEVTDIAREDALIVMATHGRQRLGQALRGSVAEDVVRTAVGPVLLAGPRSQALAWPNRLVIATDGSADAARVLDVALAFARRLDLKVHLVEVLDPAASQAALRANPGDLVESSAVKALARLVHDAGLACTWDVVHDHDPANGLVRVADQAGDVLALATHARRGRSLLLEGSVTAAVLHRSTCPVLVVRV